MCFLQPPFEENGIASPIGDKTGGTGSSIRTSLNLMTSNGGISNGVSNGSTLGTSIDSALVPSPNTYPKNRFLSGDLNSNAYLRRQFISIGKYTLIFLEHFEKKINFLPKRLDRLYEMYYSC